MLNLLNYADGEAAVLKKKTALINALDEANVHGRSVEVITYDVFIATDLPTYVADLVAAAKAAGCSSVTEEKAATLFKEVDTQATKGLNGCYAKFLLQVLAALLRAGPCNGRALENEEDVAKACIAAGLHKEINDALKHLLDPLNKDDGDEPSGNSAKKKKERKRWNERRVVARRVADLLHEMGIHKNGVSFASYAAVQEEWNDIKDKLKQKAEEAQFKKDLDDIDDAEDEEPPRKKTRSSKPKP